MMLAIYMEAPFAVCRTFTAGWYRPTATFLTPSAAYGLLLNLAGVETRLREEAEPHGGKVPTTLMRAGLPTVRLALGVPTVRREGRHWKEIETEFDRYPRVQTLYQQLHNYLAGGSDKVDDPEKEGQKISKEKLGLRRTKHSKYNITPVRRELLVGLRAIIALDGDLDLEQCVIRGLSGQLGSVRYGLPFVGDNSFLPDRIEQVKELPATHWYERVTESNTKIRPRTTRLTYWIDRADLSKTKSALYAPGDSVSEIPPTAWTAISPPN